MAAATFFSDPYLLVLLGAFFSLAASPRLRPTGQRAFWGGLLACLGVTAAAVYFYLRNPDWMWAYVAPRELVPAWLPWALILLYPVVYLSGYLLGHAAGRTGARRLFLVSLGAALAVHLALLPRWTSWTSAWDFHGGARGGLVAKGVWVQLAGWTAGVGLLTLALFAWARREAGGRRGRGEGG